MAFQDDLSRVIANLDEKDQHAILQFALFLARRSEDGGALDDDARERLEQGLGDVQAGRLQPHSAAEQIVGLKIV